MRAQCRPGMAPSPASDCARPARRDHPSATVAALGTQIDDPVGGRDNVEVVLDDEHEWPAASSASSAASRRETSSRCSPVVGSSKMNRQWSPPPAARRFASFSRCASPPERVGTGWPSRRVVETHRCERRQRSDDVRALGEEGERVFDRHLQDVGDRSGGPETPSVLVRGPTIELATGSGEPSPRRTHHQARARSDGPSRRWTCHRAFARSGGPSRRRTHHRACDRSGRPRIFRCLPRSRLPPGHRVYARSCRHWSCRRPAPALRCGLIFTSSTSLR